MARLPAPVAKYAWRAVVDDRHPAWLRMSPDGRLAAWGGDLAAYGMESPPAEDGPDFLKGLLPLKGAPLLLPCVETDSGSFADLHLIPGDDGDWVLLLDASDWASRQAEVQQICYESALVGRMHSGDRNLGTVFPQASGGSIAESAQMSLSAALGYLVLERDAQGSFRMIGAAPGWARSIFPRLEAAQTIKLPELGLPVLETLLSEFEEVWTGRRLGPAVSGTWIAPDSAGLEWRIEAASLRLGSENLLVLHASEFAKDEGRRVLQRAREQALERIHLEKESQKRDLLIHTIVHDLKVPAIATQSFLQLISRSRTDPGLLTAMAEHLKRLYEKQLGMISEILETFGSEAGAMEAFVPDPKHSPDATACAQAACELFQPYSALRRVDVRLDVPQTACLVVAETQRLERVFLNLIDNAVQMSPADATVIVRVRDEGDSFRCEVEDSGPGVPPERAPSLFQKFARGRGSRGTIGLGLYFSRLMVERWGGTIGYLPREGGGAIFWFRLRKPTA